MAPQLQHILPEKRSTSHGLALPIKGRSASEVEGGKLCTGGRISLKEKSKGTLKDTKPLQTQFYIHGGSWGRNTLVRIIEIQYMHLIVVYVFAIGLNCLDHFWIFTSNGIPECQSVPDSLDAWLKCSLTHPKRSFVTQQLRVLGLKIISTWLTNLSVGMVPMLHRPRADKRSPSLALPIRSRSSLEPGELPCRQFGLRLNWLAKAKRLFDNTDLGMTTECFFGQGNTDSKQAAEPTGKNLYKPYYKPCSNVA